MEDSAPEAASVNQVPYRNLPVSCSMLAKNSVSGSGFSILSQCGSGSRELNNADPDPGSQTNADPDPDPGQTLPTLNCILT